MNYKKTTALLLASLGICSTAFCGCSKTSTDTESNKTFVLADDENSEDSPAAVYEVDAEFYLGETVFIGDSRTNGLLTYMLLPPEQVFAIDGSTQKSIREQEFIQLEPNGEFLSLSQAVKARQPNRILVAFGVNAIPLMSEEEFMDEYDILIDELVEASPESRIVIQSILPVSWWKHQSMPYLTNENIDRFNSLLEDYCEENGYTFFDPSDHFKGEDGSLDQEFDAGDGLHFRQNFYSEYINILVTERP